MRLLSIAALAFTLSGVLRAACAWASAGGYTGSAALHDLEDDPDDRHGGRRGGCHVQPGT